MNWPEVFLVGSLWFWLLLVVETVLLLFLLEWDQGAIATLTLVATLLNIGLRSDFIIQWVKAYLVAWPIAAITGYFIMPAARRLTVWIVNRMDGTA